MILLALLVQSHANLATNQPVWAQDKLVDKLERIKNYAEARQTERVKRVKPPGTGKKAKAEEQNTNADVTESTSHEENQSKPSYGAGTQYWDARYLERPEPFEWLQKFDDVRDILEKATDNQKTRRILNIGCGNGLITEEMYDNGYNNIINVDNSVVVIDQMNKRNLGMREGMTWLVGDATNMTFEDRSFDLVLDKSVLDTFACGSNSDLVMGTFLKEVMRVLSDHGVYVSISYREPKFRMNHLQNVHLDWDVTIMKMEPKWEDAKPNFVYMCRKKGGEASQKSLARWPEVKANLQRLNPRERFGR